MMSVRREDVGVRCGGWRSVRRGDSASVRGGGGADGAGMEALSSGKSRYCSKERANRTY